MASGVGGVGPGRLGADAVALFWLRSADGEQLEAVWPGLEGAHDRGRDADDVPLRDVAHLVVEAHAARAGDDHVGLLLLAMAVTARVAQVRGVAPVADAQVAGAEVLAAEAPLQTRDPSLDGIVDLEQVHDRVVGHGRTSSPLATARTRTRGRALFT